MSIKRQRQIKSNQIRMDVNFQQSIEEDNSEDRTNLIFHE